MSYSVTDQVVLGSGDVYLVAYTTSLPADDTTFEADTNKLGHIQGGAVLTYKPKSLEIKADDGTIVKRYILDKEVSFKTGVIEWNVDKLAKVIGDGTLTEDATKNEKVLTIGSGITGLQAYAIRYVSKLDDGKKMRITFVGTNESGLSLNFQSDKQTNLDAEFKAMPQTNGTLLEIRQEEVSSI